MLERDEMTEALGDIRDRLCIIMAQHEVETHDGRPCWGNRASAIAHLAHCLGIRGSSWDYAKVLLDEYDAACPGQPACAHLRN